MLIVIPVIFLSACEDFLDVQSESDLTIDNFYQTYEDARAATAPLYSKVWFDFNNEFYYRVGDGRANNLFYPYGSGDPLTTLTETSETEILLDGWTSLYTVVTQSTYAVINLDKAIENGVPTEQVNECKAEARFMRGLAYWYLGSTWGNVPIIDDPSELAVDFDVPSNPFEDVLQYAIRDLEYAAEWLPETDDAGRVTKYSALAALARVYISAACYARGGRFSSRWTTTAGEYYEMAKNAAKTVIEESSHELMSDFEELFMVQNNNNSESIFALQFLPGSSEWGVGNRLQTNLAYSSELTNGMDAYGGSAFAGGDLVELLHTRNDSIRIRATIFRRGSTYYYLGTHTAEGYWHVPDDEYNPRYPNFKKHVVGSNKDTGGVAIDGNSGMAVPMIRLAEVYLLYAEAILGVNTSTADGEALTYFNKVRARVGLDPVNEITLDTIWNERRCELALEGQFWFDMVRRAYWDEAYVLNYMGSQRRNEYYFYYNDNVPDGFRWRDIVADHDQNPPTADRLLLSYPANELTYNPKLKEEPVPYDFGE